MIATRVPVLRRTPTFDFLFGRYSYSTIVIPYFQLCPSLHDVAQHLRLIGEIPDAASIGWSFEELNNLSINWDYVQRELVPYLTDREQPQFLNGLTAVLLPVRNGLVGSFSDLNDCATPHLDNEEQFEERFIRQFASLTCGYWCEWDNAEQDEARLGQLTWNTDQMWAVVIDGQDRLAAIRDVAAGASRRYRHTSIPLTMVVMHPDLGFNRGVSRDALVDMMRRLFIDLNKHARTVSRARQILLDDRDPASICVRTVVGSELCTGAAQLQASPPILPLSLVDWHSEQAKFEVGPYLTTILGLDWAVANVLTIKPFEDPMAFDEAERLIDRLERMLGISLANARERLVESRRHERPFSFLEEPQNELQLIAQGFARRWCRPLVYLLSEFRPYRMLIDLRKRLDTLRPEFANWYALRESAAGAAPSSRASRLLDEFEAQLSSRDRDPVAIGDLRDAVGACSELKEQHQLAFTVVFQRAMVLAFRQLTRVGTANLASDEEDFDIEGDLSDDVSESEEELGPVSQESERAQVLVAALNHVVAHEPEFLKIHYEFPWDDDDRFQRFWLCSLAQPEGTIDFTQGASKRAADLLLLIGLFWLYREYEELDEDGFNLLIDRADDATAGMDLKLKQCFNRMWSAETSIAGRILSSRDEDIDDDNDRREEIRGRAAWLWKVVCR
jgi:hypothetical protein